ncbi:MAG: hypothetical protein ACLU3I_06990 [Acutalibacteraceae bacterium]
MKWQERAEKHSGSGEIKPLHQRRNILRLCSARISVEDERKREADTIGNQIQLLRDFAGEDPDISVFDVYCDDDVSGTDFPTAGVFPA